MKECACKSNFQAFISNLYTNFFTMSNFHSSVRDLLEDAYNFLTDTLHKEVLSSSAQAHREKLLSFLHDFQKEYPQLQLNIQVSSDLDNAKAKPEFVRYPPSSPLPYVDMNCGSPYKMPSNVSTDSDSYDVCALKERQENSEIQSLTESEGYTTDEGKCIPDVAASDLHTCDKSGYLDKKRESIKGWLNPFQRRWCSIKDGILYYYDKTSDRKQKGSIVLSGYEARLLLDDNKEAKKYNHCFEIVCPGKKTYQFCAASEIDLKQWMIAIEENSKVCNSEKTACRNSQNSDKLSESHSTFHVEDIYEIVEDGVENDASAKEILDEEYSDVEPSNNLFNYSDWYVGLWDCLGSDETELTFYRGDLIHILSKEYDTYSWWIGELQGKIGFVPKAYLMEAYEAC